jgi:glyoxylase-like metal-dependent hydrolase (beta-lactamase superfamily II)
MNTAKLKTPSLESKEIFPGIHQITHNSHVYSWLITGRTQSLLIDTGWGMSDLKALTEKLSPSPVIVANTHCHFDHTFGNYQFERVFISEEDLPLVLQSCRMESRLERLKDYDASGLPGGISTDDWLESKHPHYGTLTDGKVFELGDRTIEVITTPGHTPGSVCFLDREGRNLFTGDTIYRGYLLLHFPHSTELSVYRSSLEKICSRKAEFDTILPSHGRVPLPNSFAEDILAGVKMILEGKNHGDRHTFRGTKCLISKFDDFFIVREDVTE